MRKTSDLRVVENRPLVTPDELLAELPITPAAAESVARARDRIEEMLQGGDRRLLGIIGPCSIHDPGAALDFAGRLLRLRSELEERLFLCMRVYFEKPRTSLGWKGLINDPYLDGSCDLAEGLKRGRKLLLELGEMGMPAATEMLDPISPQYIADLVAWTAIGARTTESQTHREMASGLSMPVGFKNGTDGDLGVAVNAMKAARQKHSFLGIDGSGRVSVVRTAGNPFCHLVLRGGSSGPNYGREQIAAAVETLSSAGLNHRVLVDCSHANSRGDPRNQCGVLASLAEQLREGSPHILGFMMESNLVAGRQDLGPWSPNPVYGQSITDACIDFPTTEKAVRQLVESL
jgi:3-deoxy-7-phosphoheptulonate synthase